MMSRQWQRTECKKPTYINVNKLFNVQERLTFFHLCNYRHILILLSRTCSNGVLDKYLYPNQTMCCQGMKKCQQYPILDQVVDCSIGILILCNSTRVF